MLEPLELLRDAGVRFVVLFVGAAFCVLSGRLRGLEALTFGGVADFNGTFLTVFVETALLIEERELRRLARELLRSTSRRRFADPSLLAPALTRIDVARFVCSCEILDGGAPRSERDFSKLC